MGRWQPYMYDPQRTSDDFNPKAVTMASYEPPPPKKTKSDGPLVNFNKHPDSYVVMPYGKTDAKPMNPRVKVWIKFTRGTQLFLRLCTLLGAIGVLLCAIFIRGAQNTEGYIMRIPPGVDMVHCLYATYHLIRAAKARPAGSSASYHFFALVMDGGFIPFFVFTALFSKRNYDLEAGTKGRWRTFFPTDEETDKVLLTTWLTAITVAGLHCLSLILDLYLLIVFRKISHLPPDMNPLEGNLTRRKTKHKHKNSSISAITPLTAEDKRYSTRSEAATLVESRKSQLEPFISEKEIPTPDGTKLAFLHTRTDSGMTYSPHTPNSARHSRIIYSQANNSQAREDDDGNETLAQRKSLLTQQAGQKSSTMSSNQTFYTPPTTADETRTSGDISQQGLQSDNWFVHDGSGDENDRISSRVAKPSMFTSKAAQGYHALSPYDDNDDLEPPLMPQPLRMNPPTPPPNQTATQGGAAPPQLKRMNTVTTLSSEATFRRSPSRPTTPGKTRYYGDLKAATAAIRKNGNSATQSPSASPTKSSTPNNLPSAMKAYTTNASIVPKSMSFSSVRRTGEAGHLPVQGQSPRVISRSGVDYSGRSDFDDESDLGMPGRRRQVSGKIAEEGRGGLRSGGPWNKPHELTYRKVSEVGA